MRALCHGKSRLYQDAGITLIELMLALFISSVVLMATIHIISIYQKNTKIESVAISEISKLNQIKHIFQTEVNAAGYIGCHALTNDFYIHHSYFNLTLDNRLAGDDHQLMVRYASPQANDIAEISADGWSLTVNESPNIAALSWMLISDCRHAELVFVKKILRYKNRQKITLSQPLAYHYQSYAELSKLRYHRFFLDENKQGIKGLYVVDQSGQKTELIAGLDSLAFNYLEKNHGLVQQKAAADIEDWSSIVGISMRITLSGKVFDIGVTQ